jgi:hypothetical protein
MPRARNHPALVLKAREEYVESCEGGRFSVISETLPKRTDETGVMNLVGGTRMKFSPSLF